MLSFYILTKYPKSSTFSIISIDMGILGTRLASFDLYLYDDTILLLKFKIYVVKANSFNSCKFLFPLNSTNFPYSINLFFGIIKEINLFTYIKEKQKSGESLDAKTFRQS